MNNNYIIVILIIVLILLIILYILFKTYEKTDEKTYENYSNANISSLSPSSYNSINCKPHSGEVQYPKAYNDSCNMENSLDTFLTPSKYSKNKQLAQALSLHTLPKLHSSKKLFGYNEYCDISQGSLTNNIPYAYNEYCMTQIRLRYPLETSDNSNNTYVSPLAILATPQNIYSTFLQRQFNSSYSETNDPIIYPSYPSDIATTNVRTITTRPSGYGNINGWYSTAKSEYLLDNPITIYYEQMNINYAPNTWKILHIPTANELPIYGPWWNWTNELENINRLIDYLGNTLGKFETHIIAATSIVNPLIWVRKMNKSRSTDYEIINNSLQDALLIKINVNTDSVDARIVFTNEEWQNFNINNINTLHYIKVGTKQYKAFSPGSDRVNTEALTIINRDINTDPPIIGAIGTPEDYVALLNGEQDTRNINNNLKVEECGGVCLLYKTKSNRKRIYIMFDIGTNLYRHMGTTLNDNEKKNWLRKDIYAVLSHEYCHVMQLQILDPTFPPRWGGEVLGFGENAPHSISRWWLECFAYLLPDFMSLGFNNFNIQNEIAQSINDIKTQTQLTVNEFSDRLMYAKEYGYVSRRNWGYLATAYMAKLKSWKYVLVDFYYDFQRVPSDTPVTRNGTITYVPELDKLFLHNFNKTEKAFLQDIYAKVKNNTITIDYLSDVLPGGSNFGIPGLIKFNQSNLI